MNGPLNLFDVMRFIFTFAFLAGLASLSEAILPIGTQILLNRAVARHCVISVAIKREFVS